jgi:hypothetical protein
MHPLLQRAAGIKRLADGLGVAASEASRCNWKLAARRAGGSSGSASCWPPSLPTGPVPHPATASTPAAAPVRPPAPCPRRPAFACLPRASPGQPAVAPATRSSRQRPLQRQPVLAQLRRWPAQSAWPKSAAAPASRAQNALVEHGGLGKVGNLRRPADNGRGREQKILKDRPQQRRGRDALRLGRPECPPNPRWKSSAAPPAKGRPAPAALGAVRLSASRAPVRSSMRNSRLDCGPTATCA